MAQGGDVITYTFSGAKETEDISEIDEIEIQEMHGADGGDTNNHSGGSGGLIESATADVSSYSTLEIWVGEGTSGPTGGFGRASGGDAGGDNKATGGGGSTELWIDSNTTFIAAADAAGGAGQTGATASNHAGGGGARGGSGGSPADNYSEAGEDAEGSGFGGDGGDGREGGDDGGQELGIATGGTLTTGGSKDGDGEITIEFIAPQAPAAPTDLSATVAD